MKTAMEIVSDIGSKAFTLQHHSESEIVKAVTFLRSVNGPMFDWLVRILSIGAAADVPHPPAVEKKPRLQCPTCAAPVLYVGERHAVIREHEVRPAFYAEEVDASAEVVSPQPAKRWTEVLCMKCGGNGVVKIPGGISTCTHCDGRCYEPEAEVVSQPPQEETRTAIWVCYECDRWWLMPKDEQCFCGERLTAGYFTPFPASGEGSIPSPHKSESAKG